MELRACDERSEPPTLRDLREALQIDKSNVSRLCSRLQKQGLIDSHPCDEDRRAKRLSLTARGRALAADIDTASRQRFEALVAALPQGLDAAVVESLEALTAAIRQVSVVDEPK
jgi:DNA-binding MarR family transcriptional regulator